MASKRHLRRKACEGKERHSTMVIAQAKSAFVFAVSRKRLHAYRCQFCSGFHLGHMPASVRQSIAARRAS